MIDKHHIYLLLSFIFCFLSTGTAENFNVQNYGAIGDGETVSTEAIQKAIDDCAKTGGTVYFPAGTFLSGSIFLKSNVALHLDHGAVLLGSTNQDDYPVTIPEYRSYTDNYVIRSLIYAEKAEHISIYGRGTIDGQGKAFKDRRTRQQPYKRRPYLIRMIECRDISIKDITLLNSPMWVQHYLACEDVLIDGISVHSLVAGNNYGIDIDSCYRVRITNCHIVSGDDAIVLKSTSNRACRNVVVNNCILRSNCNGFKLGTESNGGFNNIVFSNSTVYDTRLAAIALETVDGGILERVDVSNIIISNAGTAIFVRLGNRARPFLSKGPGGTKGDFIALAGAQTPGIGSLQRVSISHIIADSIGDIGCSITGIPEKAVQDIRLDDIHITYAGGGTMDMANAIVPEHEKRYPEYSMFGHLPAYGFYVRHVDGISMHSMRLTLTKSDLRPALVFDDVQDIDLFDFDAEMNGETSALVRMTNVNGGWIHGCRLTKQVPYFVQLENSANLKITNNDFSRIGTIIKEPAGSSSKNMILNHN